MFVGDICVNLQNFAIIQMEIFELEKGCELWNNVISSYSNDNCSEFDIEEYYCIRNATCEQVQY